MSKYLIVSLVLIFGAEAVILTVFLTSFQPSLPPAMPASGAAQTQTSAVPLNLPENFSLTHASRSWGVPKSELASWIKSPYPILVPKQSSLTNYFWLQSAIPLSTSFPKLDMMASLVLEERTVGKQLLKLAKEIDRGAENAELVMENSRAIKFTPHQLGLTLSLAETKGLISDGLISGETQVALAVEVTAPRQKLEDLNPLGIKELLATGQSDFSGSTLSRIQNIKVGSSQYNGVIIRPGEEFSFNKYLGAIDAAHGYKPELVIKPEGATPEFGGGLCQVSTTAFRAAFFAGLPITERRNHSYAVHYYEWIADDQPRAVGLDATIYSGVQDLKFINDTPGAILVWTRIEGRRLYFDFYGTPDGRAVTVDGPHPYDRRESGAVKSTVTRIVKKPGQNPVETTFNSSYVPPKTLPAVVEYPKPPGDQPPSTN